MSDTKDHIEYTVSHTFLDDDVIEKLDEQMKAMKGIGLSDIDLFIIRYAISLIK